MAVTGLNTRTAAVPVSSCAIRGPRETITSQFYWTNEHVLSFWRDMLFVGTAINIATALTAIVLLAGGALVGPAAYQAAADLRAQGADVTRAQTAEPERYRPRTPSYD